MTDLEQQVHDANVAYWNLNKPIMSDVDYDVLVNRLRKENPNSPILNEIGGVQGKYFHKVPMLSLNKAHTYDEVWDWIESTPETSHISVSAKFDGLAGKIENGHLVTRGNGRYGQDISHVIPLVTVFDPLTSTNYSVAEFIEYTHNATTLGEILITTESFNNWFKSGNIRQQDGSMYANPRNAVAGIVNRLDISALPYGLLTFVLYSPFMSYMKKDWEREDVEDSIARVSSEFSSRYPIDGVVFTIPPATDEYKQMGYTVHHPNGAIAFKFGNKSRNGIVEDIKWQQGRYDLTPVLILKEGISFDDVVVRRATLHNYEQFCKADLNVGDVVEVERAGDVIPKFIKINYKGTGPKFVAPQTCPYCGSNVVVCGKELVCANSECNGKIVPRMVHAAKCLRIDGLGPKTCKLLNECLHVSKLWQLVKWNYEKEIGMLPGFTEYSAELLCKNIRNAIGRVFDWEVCASVDVPLIGPRLWQDICSDKEFKYDENGVYIGDITCLGPIQKEALRNGYKNNKGDFDEMFKAFKPCKTIFQPQRIKICCTGTAPVPRAQIAEQIERAGYEFTNNMSDDVTILVTDDINATSNKMKYAITHNKEILTYEQLNERLLKQNP